VIADACGRAARRSLPALAATAALTAVGGGLWLGYHFVTTSSRFAIDDIQVHGTSRVSADEVRAALPVKVGDNVFTANLDGISEQVLAHPWVAAAEVHRILPHTVVVDIREYEAVAMVTLPSASGSDLYLVDGLGHPFKRADVDAGEGAGLPIVTGIERAAYQRDPATSALTITSALAVLDRWRASDSSAERPAIGEIHVDAHGGLTLRSYDHGTAIQIGQPGNAEDLTGRMRTFDTAWAELTDTERMRARAIHLDARPDHVIVAFAKD